MTCSDFLDYYGIGHFVAACIKKIYDIRYSQQSLKGNANQSQSQPAHYRDIHSLTTQAVVKQQCTVYSVWPLMYRLEYSPLAYRDLGRVDGSYWVLHTQHTYKIR